MPNHEKTNEKLSASGAYWLFPTIELHDALHHQRYAQQYDIPENLIGFLWRHGVINAHSDDDTLDIFFNPKLRYHLPDPRSLPDIDHACATMTAYLNSKQPIGIFGDYDVDGTASSAMMTRYFKQLQRDCFCHLPDRFSEGYGPNIAALTKLYQQGARLILLLDCGTSAHDVINAFTEKYSDCQIIIIDHHQQSDELPKVNAVINANRLDMVVDDFKYCCAAGIGFMFMIALNRYLREQEYFNNNQLKEPDIMPLLSYVAMATICDVVPLQDINRLFVKQGLKIIRQMNFACFAALAKITALDAPIDAQTIGFQFGPRINAAGRMRHPHIAYDLFICDDIIKAEQLAQKCDDLNQKRKSQEQDILNQTLIKISMISDDIPKKYIHCYDNDWHIGLLGIIAARLKEKFYKPAFITSFGNDDIGVGSARGHDTSLHIGNLLHKAHDKNIIMSGGGHNMAGGYRLHRENIAVFEQFLQDELNQSANNTVPTCQIDISLHIDQCHIDFATQIDKLSPFGAGLHEPLIHINDVMIKNIRIIGNDGNSILCYLHAPLYDGKHEIKALAFRHGDDEIGAALYHAHATKTVIDVVGYLKQDFWQGRQNLSFHIKDVRN